MNYSSEFSLKSLRRIVTALDCSILVFIDERGNIKPEFEKRLINEMANKGIRSFAELARIMRWERRNFTAFLGVVREKDDQRRFQEERSKRLSLDGEAGGTDPVED